MIHITNPLFYKCQVKNKPSRKPPTKASKTKVKKNITKYLQKSHGGPFILHKIKGICWGSNRYQGNNYKKFKPQNTNVKEPSNVPNKNSIQKEPLKCLECGGPHCFKYF